MYLLQLDESGLVSDDVIGDSWKAVSVFRELVNKYKREGLTVVALAVDYDSLLSFYNPTDRYIRAVEEVFGSRNKFKKNELISKAMERYGELQFDPDLEHNMILKDYKIRLLERIKANMILETPEGETEVNRLNGILRQHENSSKDFYSKFDKQKTIASNAVTKSGYKISRIENDLLTKKNSKFATEGKDLFNPKKLGI